MKRKAGITGEKPLDERPSAQVGMSAPLRREIEERRRMQETLRESEQRFAAFMLHLPAAAWIKDPGGRYIYANAEAERVFSGRLEAFRGKTDFDIFPEGMAKQFVENDRRVLAEGGSIETTEVLRQADGIDHYFVVSKFAVPGPDRRPAYVAGVAFDITDRIRLEQALQSTNAQLRSEIHERELMEEKLRESEGKFRGLTERSMVGVYLIHEGRFDYVNPRFADIFGYTAGELTGKPYESLVMPDDLEFIRECVRKRLEGIEKFGHYTFRGMRKDNEVIHLEVHNTVTEYKGSPAIIGALVDITERKQTEKALEESEKRFRTLFEQAAVGVAEIDPLSGRFIHVNKRYCDITGFSLDEMLKTNFQSITHPDDLEADLNNMKALIEGEINEFSMDKRYIRKDGGIVWVNLTVYPTWLSSERPARHIAIVEDITQRKQAEEALRERETRLSMIYDEVYDIIFVIAVEPQDRFRFVSVNRRFLEATGLQEDRVAGRLVTEVIPEPSCSFVLEKYREAVRTGKSVQWEEVTGYPSGEKFADVSIAPVCDASRTCTQLIGTVHDVTERKLAEKALRAAHDELEQKVIERTRELSEANRQLRDLDRLKSMFIASMSHELRTPLNSIIGFSSILRDEWAGPLNAEQKDNVSIILRSGKHLLALINDVIDVSKIEAGKIESLVEDFDIHSVISEAVAAFKKDMDDKGLELKQDAQHYLLHTDRRRLLQSVLNLVGNAVKFTEKGSVSLQARVNAECKGCRLPALNSELDGNNVVISVTDTGVGLKEPDAARLFNAFSRAESTRNIPGTGLGLYLTKKLVTEVLKGEITVASEYGRGSTFTIRIPVSI